MIGAMDLSTNGTNEGSEEPLARICSFFYFKRGVLWNGSGATDITGRFFCSIVMEAKHGLQTEKRCGKSYLHFVCLGGTDRDVDWNM